MIGDGDPREYGGRLPDGTLWTHPPYGPFRRQPRLFPDRRVPWWWRALRRLPGRSRVRRAAKRAVFKRLYGG